MDEVEFNEIKRVLTIRLLMMTIKKPDERRNSLEDRILDSVPGCKSLEKFERVITNIIEEKLITLSNEVDRERKPLAKFFNLDSEPRWCHICQAVLVRGNQVIEINDKKFCPFCAILYSLHMQMIYRRTLNSILDEQAARQRILDIDEILKSFEGEL